MSDVYIAILKGLAEIAELENDKQLKDEVQKLLLKEQSELNSNNYKSE